MFQCFNLIKLPKYIARMRHNRAQWCEAIRACEIRNKAPILTYTLAILEESQCAVPRIQMDSDDGPLSKAGGEVHLLSFMMQQALQKGKTSINKCGKLLQSHSMCPNPTGVRKTPAVCVFSQQAAERMSVFV